MVSRCSIEGCPEIGAYTILTDKYAIIPNCATVKFTWALTSSQIKIIRTDIAGLSIIGTMMVGNKHGILVPQTATNNEINELSNNLPEIIVEKIFESNSALGNVISCNDKFALVSDCLSDETLEAIYDTLQVEPIQVNITDNCLVGSYCVISNVGGVVTSKATDEDATKLSEFLGINIEKATINRGRDLLKSGMCVNSNILLCGKETTSNEIANLSRIFQINDKSDIDLNIDQLMMSFI